MDAAGLPTTSIGLIAFIVVVLGLAVKYIADKSQKNTETFMSYIQTKNHNLEKATELFAKTTAERDRKFEQMLEENNKRHTDMMVEQNNSHREILDDAAARIESLVSRK